MDTIHYTKLLSSAGADPEGGGLPGQDGGRAGFRGGQALHEGPRDDRAPVPRTRRTPAQGRRVR